MKLGNDERNIPGWIQDHITNAENYIDQAAQGFHELHGGEEDTNELPDGTEEEPMTLQGMMEDLLEAKKKPSAGLTKKQKSTIAKKAASGKDIGKKGKGKEFKTVASKVAASYEKKGMSPTKAKEIGKATAGTYRIAVRVAGAALAAAQYLAYDVSLPGNASDTLTLGITLGATDVITVYSSAATFSFNVLQ